MVLSYYLHDLFYEIGHSNVTLNSIEYLPNIENHKIKFIVYTSEKPEKLFKKNINVSIHYVPMPWLKPVFLKIIWFQIYTFFYALFIDRNSKKISLGMASLYSDITIIHFIHRQWSNIYFNLIKPKGGRYIYKKVFFTYLNICESLIFSLRKPKLICVSDFLKNHLTEKFNYDENSIQVIHNGFDLTRFNNSKLETNQILKKLIQENSKANKIDTNLPIYLFVGAFERKGLQNVLNQWTSENPAQLIIIGKSESGQKYDLNHNNIIHIDHTSNINLYYEISDCFLFPTIYEPFGMVIIESLVKGLNLVTTKENVGASEIVQELEGVTIFDKPEDFSIPKPIKLTKEDKELRSNKRKEYFKSYNWQTVGQRYSNTLENWIESET